MVKHNDERDLAILWARKALETNFFIIDTETTGLDNEAQAVQLGIISSQEHVVLDCLIDPFCDIPKEATDVHGVTTEHAKKFGISFFDIALAMHTICDKEIPIYAYNADFDYRILRQTAKTWGISLRLQTFIDVMKEFARFYGEWDDYHGNFRWKKLTFAAGYFDILTTGAHGAAADALMTLKVMQGMAKTKLSGEK